MEIQDFEIAIKLQERIKAVKNELKSIEILAYSEHNPFMTIALVGATTGANFSFKGKHANIAAHILATFKQELETKLKSLQDEFDNL